MDTKHNTTAHTLEALLAQCVCHNAVITELLTEMVYVKGGSFAMGLPITTLEQEPGIDSSHPMTVGNFYIGKYPISQLQWETVMGNNPSMLQDHRHPVENISWNDCQEFIEQLNTLTGLHFSLPSEAQWEYAARGGEHSKGYTYAGSNEVGQVAWYRNNSQGVTYPAGLKRANELGLFDMSGNVAEWCADLYEPGCEAAQRAVTDAESDPERVQRGGSFYFNPELCRVYHRGHMIGNARAHMFGLRIVLTPSEECKIPLPAAHQSASQLTPSHAPQGAVNYATVKQLLAQMVYIPGGSFVMGTDAVTGDERAHVCAPHAVTLPSFYMGRFPVTQMQWEAVMGKNPSQFKDWEQPVENVSWDDAHVFVERLRHITDMPFALPTEAQWEYAARGGKLADTQWYAGSNNPDEVAWYNENSHHTTHKPGLKKGNALQLFDLCGNVAEWCSDLYKASDQLTTINTMGHEGEPERVMRGGSFFFTAKVSSVFHRLHIFQSAKSNQFGLRLVLNDPMEHGGGNDVLRLHTYAGCKIPELNSDDFSGFKEGNLDFERAYAIEKIIATKHD